MLEWDTDFVLDLLLESAEIAHRIKSDPHVAVKDDRMAIAGRFEMRLFK